MSDSNISLVRNDTATDLTQIFETDVAKKQYGESRIADAQLETVTYRLPNGEEVIVDPNDPKDVEAKLGGKIITELPSGWSEGSNSTAVKNLYGEKADAQFFKTHKLHKQRYSVMFSGSGTAIMDPLGMLNPAATIPIRFSAFNQ